MACPGLGDHQRLPVLPIARPTTPSGLERFCRPFGAADTFVLALPLAENDAVLALGAYLGGFSRDRHASSWKRSPSRR